MKGNANERFAYILSQSSSSHFLFPRDGENEELGFCCFFLLELTVEISAGLGGALEERAYNGNARKQACRW